MDTDIVRSTRAYETWLASRTRVVSADLRLKHLRMAESPFGFLRATFYRWLQRWSALPASLVGAPEVIAVGDLHVENFGTWRDAEGRLIWGVNDVDEACVLPYTPAGAMKSSVRGGVTTTFTGDQVFKDLALRFAPETKNWNPNVS
jgi:Uncharacterized protein conserved in bacteria (DUF2252)